MAISKEAKSLGGVLKLDNFAIERLLLVKFNFIIMRKNLKIVLFKFCDTV